MPCDPHEGVVSGIFWHFISHTLWHSRNKQICGSTTRHLCRWCSCCLIGVTAARSRLSGFVVYFVWMQHVYIHRCQTRVCVSDEMLSPLWKPWGDQTSSRQWTKCCFKSGGRVSTTLATPGYTDLLFLHIAKMHTFEVRAILNRWDARGVWQKFGGIKGGTGPTGHEDTGYQRIRWSTSVEYCCWRFWLVLTICVQKCNLKKQKVHGL